MRNISIQISPGSFVVVDDKFAFGGFAGLTIFVLPYSSSMGLLGTGLFGLFPVFSDALLTAGFLAEAAVEAEEAGPAEGGGGGLSYGTS